MPANDYRPMDSSMGDAEVIVLDSKAGVIDTTPRPITGKRLEELKAYLAKQDELKKLAEEYQKKKESQDKDDANGQAK